MEEARKLGHNYVGTEHILLGLLREGEGVAANVLENLGMDVVEVRTQVLDLLGHDSKDPPKLEQEIGPIPCSPETNHAKWINQHFTTPHGYKFEITTEGEVNSFNDNALLSKDVAASSNDTLTELKKLLIQQAEITTQMLKLLK